MAKKLLLISIISLNSMADSSFIQSQYTSLKQGGVQDQAISLFGKIEQKKSFLENDIEIESGFTANGVLKKSAIINFFTKLNDFDILVHQLSANYYFNRQTVLSLGRENMNLNLLNGSFDGVLVASTKDELFFKAFYFKHYAYLVPTLYEHKTLHGLTGITVNYAKEWFDSEFSYFYENSEHRSNLYVGYLKKPFKAGIEQMQFISSTKPNERAYKAHVGMKKKHFYMETGFMHVYDGALKNIYAFGGSEFNTFGLTSFLDNQNAKNIYVNVVYNHRPLYTKFHVGQTHFNAGVGSYLGKEVGVTIGYTYKDVHATLQAMTEKSDQIGFLGNRISWVHTNLEYRF